MEKEAKARIRINRLLQHAERRFFDDEKGPANIALSRMPFTFPGSGIFSKHILRTVRSGTS